jgi:hypothetical protein
MSSEQNDFFFQTLKNISYYFSVLYHSSDCNCCNYFRQGRGAFRRLVDAWVTTPSLQGFFHPCSLTVCAVAPSVTPLQATFAYFDVQENPTPIQNVMTDEILQTRTLRLAKVTRKIFAGE